MKIAIIALLFINLFAFELKAQTNFKYSSEQLTQIKKLKAKVEANPENMEAHQAFIYSYILNDPALAIQYQNWMKQFPKSFSIPFAIAKKYVLQKNPNALPFLFQANKLKPENAETWDLLSQFALFTNNVKLQQAYLQKAIHFDPTNAEYAFYYAFSFKDTDPARYDSLSLEVARRFPNNEYGTIALAWLAESSINKPQKIAYLRQLYNRKADQLSNWYLDGVTELFDLLLNTNPEQAFEFGLTLILDGTRNRNLWYERIKVAKIFLQARELLIQNKPQQALAILNQVDLGTAKHGNLIDTKETLALFKAEAANAGKQTNIAYDSLATYYSKKPTDRLHEELYKYGNKLGLDSDSITKNICKIRMNMAPQATGFCLENYLKPEKLGLVDFLGKVIVLTYWQPGCFTCKEQFLHFEPVIKKFDSTKVVYLALNIDPVEDEFVLPYLKASGYSFIPLKDYLVRGKGNLKAGLSVAYVIDQKGRLMFSNLERSKEGERTLELMISELLAAKDY